MYVFVSIERVGSAYIGLLVSMLVSVCCLHSFRFGNYAGVGVVSARCVLFLFSVIATMVCIYLYRCEVACLFHRNQFLI